MRPDAADTLAQLRQRGLQPVLLSGDGEASVRRVATGLPLALARGQLSPAGKLDAVRRWQAAGETVAMVGDGINDGPALAAADVSVALGDGTALAREQADLILASGRLADLATAHRSARQAVRIMRQNLGWAMAYNLICVPLALLGYMPPWAAGLGMALSSLLVIGNAMRLLRPAAPPSGSAHPALPPQAQAQAQAGA